MKRTSNSAENIAEDQQTAGYIIVNISETIRRDSKNGVCMKLVLYSTPSEEHGLVYRPTHLCQ